MTGSKTMSEGKKYRCNDLFNNPASQVFTRTEALVVLIFI